MLGIDNAEHEESAPNADKLIINKLACSLVGKTERVIITSGSLACQAFGKEESIEDFRCNYGLNPEYREQFVNSALRVVGVDPQGEPRMVELPSRRFFVGTLFLPQLSSTQTAPHPLIVAFLRAALSFQRTRNAKH